MTAALNRPATGTVTNHARKMFLKRRQSTAFWERIQPTATTEPTWRPEEGEGEREGEEGATSAAARIYRDLGIEWLIKGGEELQLVQAFLFESCHFAAILKKKLKKNVKKRAQYHTIM